MRLQKNENTKEALIRENAQLKKENEKLRQTVRKLDGFKSEYDKLNQKLRQLRREYETNIKQLRSIETKFCRQMEKFSK